MKNKHIGSNFDDFLKKEGFLKDKNFKQLVASIKEMKLIRAGKLKPAKVRKINSAVK